MLVKNQIGRLFEDLQAPPYTDLFNDSTSAREVWRAVCVMRAADHEVEVMSTSALPRASLIAAHGNRFLLYLVFQDPALSGWRDERVGLEQLKKDATQAARGAFSRLATYLDQYEPNAYLQPLFKTLDRCKRVIQGLQPIGRSATAQPAPRRSLGTLPFDKDS